MAVDYRGQPITDQTAFTTTGIMNRKPADVAPLKMPAIKQPEPKIEEKQLAEERIPQINWNKIYASHIHPKVIYIRPKRAEVNLKLEQNAKNIIGVGL